MTILSVAEFIGICGSWMDENVGQIAMWWPLKGGWEGAAQVGIVSRVHQHDPTIHILREQRIYPNPNLSADILINGQQDPSSWIIVELKCQSFENYGRFAQGLGEDVKKLQTLSNPTNPNNPHPAGKIALGFYFFTDEAHPVGPLSEPQPPSFQFTHPSGEIAMCYYFWQ